MTDEPIYHRATDECVAHLLATRRTWVEGEIRQVIGTATQLGRGWPDIAMSLLRIAFDGGEPRDLCPVPVAKAVAVAAAGPNPEYLETRATVEGRHQKGQT